jgi:hypothetical protein
LGEQYSFHSDRFVEFCKSELDMPPERRHAWAFLQHREERRKYYEKNMFGEEGWRNYWKNADSDPARIAARLYDTFMSGILYKETCAVDNPYGGSPSGHPVVEECFSQFMSIPHHYPIDRELYTASFHLKKIKIFAEVRLEKARWNQWARYNNVEASERLNRIKSLDKRLNDAIANRAQFKEKTQVLHDEIMEIRNRFPSINPSDTFMQNLSNNADLTFKPMVFSNPFAINRMEEHLKIRSKKASF